MRVCSVVKTDADPLQVRELLHDSIQSLAVKQLDYKQRLAGLARKGKTALAAGETKQAQALAQRWKLYARHASIIEGVRLNLERIHAELEVLHTLAHAHQALASGSAALDQALKLVDVHRVEQLLSTIEGQLETGAELGDALMRPLAPSIGAGAGEEEDAQALLDAWAAEPAVVEPAPAAELPAHVIPLRQPVKIGVAQYN